MRSRVIVKTDRQTDGRTDNVNLISSFRYLIIDLFHQKVFTGFLGDLGAILAMTAGDTNYAETFHHQTNWNNGGIIKTIFFFMFLAIFPMTYMSISLGIIFDKIKVGMERKSV